MGRDARGEFCNKTLISGHFTSFVTLPRLIFPESCRGQEAEGNTMERDPKSQTRDTPRPKQPTAAPDSEQGCGRGWRDEVSDRSGGQERPREQGGHKDLPRMLGGARLGAGHPIPGPVDARGMGLGVQHPIPGAVDAHWKQDWEHHVPSQGLRMRRGTRPGDIPGGQQCPPSKPSRCFRSGDSSRTAGEGDRLKTPKP